ncbi:hypothetical protein EXN66_Car005064 [Channa argus]|uniref:Uncharacterized protein n=1 Tax=Channa argus TaxID=215402 RepID=A0A6G1PGN1_CHAAH|nr:hypothetical protein EXN66_Car005064 [Channa argus]
MLKNVTVSPPLSEKVLQVLENHNECSVIRLLLSICPVELHSVNTEYESLISAPASVCVLVCVFTSAVIIANLLNCITGPNECLRSQISASFWGRWV